MILMIGAAVPPLKGLFASPARLALLLRGLAVSAPAVGGDRISALRIYFPMSLLMEQISG